MTKPIPAVRLQPHSYGFDLLWQEAQQDYWASIQEEMALDISPTRRKMLQSLIDNNMIQLDNSTYSKHGDT